MDELFPPWEGLDRVVAALASGRAAANLQAGVPYLAARLALAGRSVLILTDEERGELLTEDARVFASQAAEGWSVGFFPAEASSKERSALLEEAVEGKRLVWFASRASLGNGLPSRGDFVSSRLTVKVGKVLPHASLVEGLSKHGYQRVGFVEDPGQFAVRGEVFDFWSPNHPEAVRIVYDNDVVETMHFFEPGSQLTSSFVPEVTVVPISERRPPGAPPPSGSLIEFLPPDAVIVVDRLRVSPEEPLPDFGGRPVLELVPGGTDLGVVPSTKVRLQWDFFIKELKDNAAQGVRSFVFCQNMGETQRLEDILDQLRCPEELRPVLLIGALGEGFASGPLKMSVWGFGELVGVRPFARRLPKFKMGRALDSMSEIRAGDYIVHERFGIGRYRGLERISLRAPGRSQLTRRDKVSEFLALEYKNGDRLLVPIQDFRLVQKFVGQEGKKPQLSSLDGAAWERVKQKIRKEIAELAAELLENAALRAASARPEDADPAEAAAKERLQREFAEAFPYEETPDQRRAIEEVLGDMDSKMLMDRLVCGDVGYGKTEIAMRAAFKAVSDGQQVLVLVPTTILAEQHFKTFTERFAAFPVRISMLSRFQKKEDQKGILADIRSGAVDIVIGTHRLLQKDVHPRDLGLIIIDEEHRFGVKQKEQVKKLKLTADVLALSATPIPRTLSQAMGGIRNISVIETPPEGRQPIETHLGLFQEEVVRDAIQRELSRGGQVFYVHNRIATIETRKKMLEKLIPSLRVGMAHGQMSGDALEKAMWNFLHKKWDVLLATSIIESGLDIPSVNTLIVEDSEEFGLAQLYQLRGRVGRKKEKAYCHLFFSDWTGLSEDARKRLDAIQEFSALGSGMKLAIRDLEIRGTGNLLGPQQHGWINAVGLELYCQLLSEEIERLKEEKGLLPAGAEKRPEIPWPEIELNVSAFIPEEYVDAPGERISFYKRMIACRGAEEMGKLRAEMQDRFGPLPEPVETLFRLIELKLEAAELRVVAISESERGVVLGWPASDGQLPLDLPRFAAEHPDLIEVLPPEGEDLRRHVVNLLFKTAGEGARDVFREVKNSLQISGRFVIIKTQ